MCLCETTYQGGYRTILGSANLLEKVLRDMGYRSDSIAISRGMGPLCPLVSYRLFSDAEKLALLEPFIQELETELEPAFIQKNVCFLVLGLVGHQAESGTFRQIKPFVCRRFLGFHLGAN